MSSPCQYTQVIGGDGCWSLAQRCGITQTDLTKYNAAPDICSKLLPDDYVCCSQGSLPNFSPKSNANGDCFTYTIVVDDTCAGIAKAHQMEASKISDYNNLTWGWSGCNALRIGQNICLSEGSPPFPASIDGALCGPQKPDTKKPDNKSPWDWADLNPCPLNACCDVWGQCGITPEFCTNSTVSGGAPGTAANNTNGCISHCGVDIKKSGVSVDKKRIGYFEAWNLNRVCDNMDISKMTDGGYYTHVHWAFGNVTEDWQVDVSGQQTQFDGLLKLQNIKRIMSFGGWGFSTDPYTVNIFRNGVKDGNRQILAANIVKFIVDKGLDGVGFDWEYPGAQDIPGVGADNLDSGKNYAAFLKLVRAQLPQDKTISMALPASYWYLRGFDPMSQFEDSISYYVYMTYDLHGQWDYGNTFVNPGYAHGNRLRSHVNKTETEYTLAMITKAGVPSDKVVPGLALYGRSFKMTDPSCKGPDCTFTGKDSGATKGHCTDTAGYISNMEIQSLISQANSDDNLDNVTISQYQDEGDILIYNDDQWVSWLTPDSYVARRDWYDSLNLGGNVDWAVDLNRTYSNNGTGDLEESDDDWPEYIPCPTVLYNSLDALQQAVDNGIITKQCIAPYTLDTLRDMLNTAYNNYTNVNNGYDKAFEFYVEYIGKVVPNILTNAFMWNMSTTKKDSVTSKIGYGMNYFQCQFPHSKNWVACNTMDNHPISFVTATNMRVSDEDGFNNALASAGLLADWVTFGDYSYQYKDTVDRPPVTHNYKFAGWPVKNASMVVQNPKDIVTKGLPDISKLLSEMGTTMLEILSGSWRGGDPRDAAMAYAPAVFMLQQAVDSMEQAKALGLQQEKTDEEEQRKRKENLILLIIGVVLMFVPVVGTEAAAALGFANLARIIAIAGEVGNSVLAVYETVKDPSSAVINIIGMLFGVGNTVKASRDAKGLASVAKWSKGMKSGEIASMGNFFSDGNGKVTKVLGKYCKLSWLPD